MGSFDKGTRSDYAEFRDRAGGACLVVHRIKAAAPAESWKQRDPAGFARKKEEVRQKIARAWGLEGVPRQLAEDPA